MIEKSKGEMPPQRHEQGEETERIEASSALRKKLLTDIAELLYIHGRTAWDVGGNDDVLKKAQELTGDWKEGDRYKKLLTDIAELLYIHGRTAWDVGGNDDVLKKARELIKESEDK